MFKTPIGTYLTYIGACQNISNCFRATSGKMEGNARTKNGLQYVLGMIVYYEIILSYCNLHLALEGERVIISIINVP